jgi:ribosome maturation factor RimP
MGNPVQTAVVERVRAVAEPLCSSLGLELVDLEYLREGSNWVLRVFIDRPGGIVLDDCSNLSNALGVALDIEDAQLGPMMGNQPYSLEVSSPGLERPLKKPSDFQRFSGQQVKVKTYAPLPGDPSGRKSFTGKLIGFSGEAVALESSDGPLVIPLKAIAKAHLLAEF